MRQWVDRQVTKFPTIFEVGLFVASIRNQLDAWSATHFPSEALTAYAQTLMLDETRRGATTLCVVAGAVLLAELILFVGLGLPQAYYYTVFLVALFTLHIGLSVRNVADVITLQVLGITLLVVTGMAFVLLAHQMGEFSVALFAAVALLFVMVPLVPWGLKEASAASGLVYIMFTASTWSAATNFDGDTLLTLQFIMIGASVIGLATVARNVSLRRSEIQTRFELEEAHKRILILSHKDPLTGAWNRRYLKGEFTSRLEEWRAAGKSYHFAFLDIDDFKPLNDTFGHDFGDLVLQWVTTGFQQALGDHGCVVRMGGDEFALLFTSEEPEQLIATGVAAVSSNALETSLALQSEVRLSVGMVTVESARFVSQERIYKEADTALYAAKARKVSVAEGVNLVRHRISTTQTADAKVVALSNLSSRAVPHTAT